MKPYNPAKLDSPFVGRERQLKMITEIDDRNLPFILVVYGRRRIGKTALIEHSLTGRNLLKFEGIQTSLVKQSTPRQAAISKDQEYQMEKVFRQLGRYLSTEEEQDEYSKLEMRSWTDLFEFLARFLKKGRFTLYFEEIQWLSSYSEIFLSELKEAWDNILRVNNQIGVVLSGSSPSFIVNSVLADKALYGRSLHEIHLKEFTLHEVKLFFPARPHMDLIDSLMIVGGIPEYLKILRRKSSMFLSLLENSFCEDAYFLQEKERIFVSSLAKSKHYHRIIEFLARKKSATMTEIKKHIKSQSGSSLGNILEDLIRCNFVERYVPVHLNVNSKLVKFSIKDPYLQFFYKFINPELANIKEGVFNDNPATAIRMASLEKWKGFVFERWCRKNHYLIAKILGFSAVRYKSGAFFNRKTEQTAKGFQIDLIFVRDDRVLTVCEMKYYDNKSVSSAVVNELENKITLLKNEFPNFKKYYVSRVLITTTQADNALLNRSYFERIVTLEDLIIS